MKNTYRSIFKWGNPKHEEKLDDAIKNIAREKFDYTGSDFENKPYFGDTEVILPDKCTLSQDVLNELAAISGSENISTDDYTRTLFSGGKHYTDLLKFRMQTPPTPPDAVVHPRSEDEIVKILQLCNNKQIAITPFGGRSSVTRGAETPQGGISLDLTKHLNQVVSLSETNQSVRVQSGMYGPAFEKYLNNCGTGYTCGHFPQSFEYSTVGGWVAARGAGQASTGYGKIEHLVIAMRIVTPAGMIETKEYPATAQGWDLNHVFIGSEGTLGIITEVTLKIRPFRPKNTRYASFLFKSFESAVQAMREAIQNEAGLPHLFRISDPEETDIAFKMKDFQDSLGDKALKLLGFKPKQRCLMFVSVEGEKYYTKAVIRNMGKMARKNKGLFIGATPTKKWLEQRFSGAYLRDPLMDIGIMTDTLETAVTWENLIPLWKAVHSYMRQRPKTISMTHISHVYENGANLYFTFLSPMEKENEMNDYIAFHKGLVDTIQANDGSLSHHHGVGRVLAPWFKDEIGENALNLMKAIKQHLDPKGILNPDGTLALDSD